MDLDDKNVYVISLDAVDVNLLPSMYQRSYDKFAPLWTRKNLHLRNDDICEFQIKIKDEKYDDHTPIQYTPCHICDIEVPKMYYNEHKQSFRHKFNSKITEIALKRVQQQINSEHNVIDEEVNPSSYFCQECNLIVNRNNEIYHKKSITHKNSIMLEKFLNDFLDYFTDNTDNISSESTNQEPSRSIVLDNPKKEDREKIDVDSINDNNDLFEIEKNNSIPNNSSSYVNTMQEAKTEHDVQTKKINSNNKTYAKILEIPPKKSLDIIANVVENKKENVLNNNKTQRILDTGIAEDESETKKRVRYLDNIMNAVEVIKENVSNDNTISKTLDSAPDVAGNHQSITEFNYRTENNITNYITLLAKKYNLEPMILKAYNEDFEVKTVDGSFVRLKFDNFHALKELVATTYCIVCSEILSSVSGHIMSEAHMKFVSILLKDKHCVREINAEVSHCVLCNKLVKSKITHVHKEHIAHLNKILTMIDSTNDQNAQNKRLSTCRVDRKIADDISTNYVVKEGFIKLKMMDSKKYFCTACNVSISKHIKKHEGTMKHLNNCKSDYHYMIKTMVNGDIMCLICVEIIVNRIFYESHFQSNTHINNYNKFISLNYLSRVDKDTLYCNRCLEYMLFKNELLHISGEKHKTQTNIGTNSDNSSENVNEISRNNINNKTNNSDKTVCIPIIGEGNLNNSNDEQNVIETDTEGAKNNKLLGGDDILDFQIERNVNNFVDTIQNLFPTVPKSVSKSDEEQNKVGVITTAGHSKNYDFKMGEGNARVDENSIADSSNKVDKNVDVAGSNVSIANSIVSEVKNCHFCAICQVKVPNNKNNIRSHDQGRAHLRNLVEKQAETARKSPEVVLRQSEVAEVKTFTHYQMKITSPDIMTCLVCNVHLTRNEANILKHIEGRNHVTKYMEYITKNFITIAGNVVFCTVCKVNCGVRCEFSHCIGRRHVQNLESILQELLETDSEVAKVD